MPSGSTSTAAQDASVKPATSSQVTQWNSQEDSTSSTTPTHAGRAKVKEAFQTIKAEDVLDLPTRPCVREGYLAAIGGGVSVGGLRWFTGATIPKSANWAVGAFILSSIVAYETCNFRRRAEKIKMQRAVEVYEQSKAEAARKREAEDRIIKEQEAARKLAEKRWYKFW